MRSFIVLGVTVVLGFNAGAAGKLPGQEVADRRTSSKDLAYAVDRWVTSNGLTVLMSPDPRVNHVVVDLSFAAGVLYEPEKRNGLAHLVEHLLATGDTPDTDYRQMLERRGALEFNAHTSIDQLAFRVIVPPEELPLALWVDADRLGTMPARLTETSLERHRQIVLQERLQRIDDAPYGTTSVAMMARLYPASHPLHSGVIGSLATLDAITLDDARTFASRYLVPANGILTLTGNFEPAVAREWIDRTLARLPAGAPAAAPTVTPASIGSDLKVSVRESLSRRPRVTLAWTLSHPLEELTEALTFGALLLTIYTDGLIHMGVSADFLEYSGGALFVLQVTMPHAADMLEAGGSAEVVYRFLAKAPMPVDLVAATFHAWDREYMRRLSSPAELARLLTQLEHFPPNAVRGYAFTERHWRLTPDEIQALSAVALKGPRLIIHARPTRPLPPRESP